MKISVLLYRSQQYEWSVSYLEVSAFTWQHSKVVYYWELHAGQQFKGDALLRFHDNKFGESAPMLSYTYSAYMFKCFV